MQTTTQPIPKFNINKVFIKAIIAFVTIALGFFLFLHFSPTVVNAAGTIGQPANVCQILGGCVSGIDQFKATGANTPDSVTKSLFKFILLLVGYAIYLASAVSVVFIVVAGYRYITSQGDETSTKAALATLKNAVIGLALAILSLTIVTLLGTFLTNFKI
jgi:Type IV secretion system pilin